MEYSFGMIVPQCLHSSCAIMKVSAMGVGWMVPQLNTFPEAFCQLQKGSVSCKAHFAPDVVSKHK